MDEAPLLGERLTALRNLHGLSQGALAAELGVSQPFLSLVERSERVFGEDLALAAGQRFDLPRSFFSVEPGSTEAAPVTFRKKASAGVRVEARVVQTFKEAARLFALVSERSGYRAADLPDAEDLSNDPAQCAEDMRSRLGIERNAAIPNVVRALERAGVGVLVGLEPYRSPTGDHVSLSRPADARGRPLVAVVATCPGAVQRMSVAHELGHLILDRARLRQIAGTRSPEEKRAYVFAAALLLPDHVIERQVSESLTLHGYLRIKAEYGMSVAAIVMRARDLGLISAARARSLQIQMSSQGWRTDEPVEIPAEQSMLFEQAVTRVFGDRSTRDIATAVGTDPALVAHWLHRRDDAATSAPVISLSERRARVQPQRASRRG